MKRRQPQFESDSDRERIVFRHLAQAAKDIAIIIAIGVASIGLMIWVTLDAQKNGW